MGTRMMLTGNYAAAHGARLARIYHKLGFGAD